MNKLNTTGKWVAGIVIVVAAVIVIALYGGSRKAPLIEIGTGTPGGANATGTPGTNSSTTAGAATGSGATGSTTKTTGSGSTGQGTMPKTVITLVTPIPGETWTIGAANLISWSREAGVPGQIELLDATTKSLVGVILNQIGPHQTSYAWNTRDVFLSRTNPYKTGVLPGRYMVKIAFDGNNLPLITSQPITIAK